jgi:hypothetical protein
MRWPTAALLLAMPMILLGCGTIYVIDQGEHYSSYEASVFTGSSMAFVAMFDESAEYTSVDPVNQADINKLYGFSDCSSHHHDNSARFGWRWYDDELQIHAYTYVGGTRVSELMGTVGFDEEHDYAIEIDGSSYIFTLDNTSLTMDRGCSGGGGLRYRLFPYFGGDETAPHDVTILVEEE